MSETPEVKATDPGSEASSEDEKDSNKRFDIREKNLSGLGNKELVMSVAKELQEQRELLETIKENSKENGMDLSDLSKFKVTNSGEPTEEAKTLRKKVIEGGKDGLTTKEIEGVLDCSNPTATSKMEQMDNAFEDLELYDPRQKSRKPRYNQPKRLRHKDIAKGKKTPKEVLMEDRDKEMITCPKCPEGEAVTNSRKVWRSLKWDCPNCGENIEDSL